MLISTSLEARALAIFQSFNPSTGLMLISTALTVATAVIAFLFQSLDWVDVDFDLWCTAKVKPTSVVSIPRLG